MPKQTDPCIYRRNLPHFQQKDGCFFVTMVLEGSIPKERLQQILEYAQIKESQRNANHLPASAFHWGPFGYYDAYVRKFLELANPSKERPLWLQNAAIAELLRESFQFISQRDCRVIAYCIMPNHVHVILDQIQRPLFRILQSFKRHTARQANILLGRTGRAFWQAESFDYLVRNELDLAKKITYVIQNPVYATLVDDWRNWEHTYLHPDFEPYCPNNPNV
jgi:putative transposase